MRDHAEGKIELRTTFVSTSRTVLENARQRADGVPATESRQGVADVGAGAFHGLRMLQASSASDHGLTIVPVGHWLQGGGRRVIVPLWVQPPLPPPHRAAPSTTRFESRS
jgi:hypothetical protein